MPLGPQATCPRGAKKKASRQWGHPTRKNLGESATPREQQPVIKCLAPNSMLCMLRELGTAYSPQACSRVPGAVGCWTFPQP